MPAAAEPRRASSTACSAFMREPSTRSGLHATRPDFCNGASQRITPVPRAGEGAAIGECRQRADRVRVAREHAAVAALQISQPHGAVVPDAECEPAYIPARLKIICSITRIQRSPLTLGEGQCRSGKVAGPMPDVAVQDKGTRVDALVQEALQSDSIKRYLDDDDFARQVRIAADTIIEQYVGW